MGLRERRLRKLEKWNIQEYLDQCLRDESLSGFFHDEVCSIREFPPSWEAAFVRASQDNRCSEEISHVCVIVLARMGCKWDGFPPLLAAAIRRSPGIMTYTYAHDFAQLSGWDLPDGIRLAVSETYHRMSDVHRFLVWLDGPSRETVRRCAERGSKD